MGVVLEDIPWACQYSTKWLFVTHAEYLEKYWTLIHIANLVHFAVFDMMFFLAPLTLVKLESAGEFNFSGADLSWPKKTGKIAVLALLSVDQQCISSRDYLHVVVILYYLPVSRHLHLYHIMSWKYIGSQFKHSTYFKVLAIWHWSGFDLWVCMLGIPHFLPSMLLDTSQNFEVHKCTIRPNFMTYTELIDPCLDFNRWFNVGQGTWSSRKIGTTLSPYYSAAQCIRVLRQVSTQNLWDFHIQTTLLWTAPEAWLLKLLNRLRFDLYYKSTLSSHYILFFTFIPFVSLVSTLQLRTQIKTNKNMKKNLVEKN